MGLKPVGGLAQHKFSGVAIERSARAAYNMRDCGIEERGGSTLHWLPDRPLTNGDAFGVAEGGEHHNNPLISSLVLHCNLLIIH